MPIPYSLKDALENLANSITRNIGAVSESIVNKNNAEADYYRARTKAWEDGTL